uniref:F-box domain-containing protein n=1 Tax=Setaria italica TaxID=4555 RepID=K3ZL28_SETIT
MKQALRGTAIPGSSSQKSAPDRISALPDELLLHVMYFLTLQEAAQTSLLSRRWQNLWASLMWLNFDAAKFSSMRTYRKFVNNALLIRSSLPVPVPLDAFWISAECDNSDDSLDYSDMHPWIRHALNSKAWAIGILKHSGPKPLSMQGYPFPFTSVYSKILGLCHCSIDDWVVPKVLQHDLLSCETFSNLEQLHLGEWFSSPGCYPLICLLRRSPGIKKLILLARKQITNFSCKELREISIHCDPRSDKRAQIITRILSAHLCPLSEIKIWPITT